jgi:hypothetical protein
MPPSSPTTTIIFATIATTSVSVPSS